MEQGRQRLDKWLWFARVVKSRTLASRLVGDGHVRLNGTRIIVPARLVQPGDVLTIALERQVRVLRIVDPGQHRGPFEQARHLYEDLTMVEIAAAERQAPG
jgi:ribosome-associated heat shock protein Hsp15